MIKFFRQIRHQLISENRFSEYLIYAIGEIILVVIGILIALQINNSNVYKKDRIKESEYMNGLLHDLNEDVRLLENSLITNNDILNGLNDVLSMLATPSKDEDLQRQMYLKKIKYTYWYAVMEFTDVTLSQLQNTGDFRLITNKAVATSIANYIKGIEDCDYMREEVQKNFHVMETSQKSLFNLSLAKKVYEFIEEDFGNMLAPIEQFNELTQKGNYYLQFGTLKIAQFYNDLLFYRSAINMYNGLLEKQKGRAEALVKQIEKSYNL